MPEELSSFLISVSIIIALALVVPCIESVAKLLRRNTPLPDQSQTPKVKPAKVYSREVA